MIHNKERLRKLIPILDDKLLVVYNDKTFVSTIANPTLKYIDAEGVQRSIEIIENEQLQIIINPIFKQAPAGRSVESIIEIIGMDGDFFHELNGEIVQWAREIQEYLAKIKVIRGDYVHLFKCLDEFVSLDISKFSRLDLILELRRMKVKDLI